MPKKPMTKKYADGGPVTKHQTLASTGKAPAGNGSNTAGYKKGGAVKKAGGRRGC